MIAKSGHRFSEKIMLIQEDGSCGDSTERHHDLEQFQEKWVPVFRQESRKSNEIERFRDSGKSGNDLEQFQQECGAVLRQKVA